LKMTKHRIHYRDFANRLSTLPLSATGADLISLVADYLAYDLEYRDRMLAALDPHSDWIAGLCCICNILHADNSRFVSALFMEWALENI